MFFSEDELANAAQAMKTDAVPIMRDLVERVSMHDQTLGKETARYLGTFERRMPWASPKNDAGVYRFVGPIAPGEWVFGRFVVLPATLAGKTYARWRPDLMDLVVFSFFDPRSFLAAGIIFHELFHAHDPRLKDPAFFSPFPDGRYPIETDAWNFESRLLDAAVGGRFSEEILHMAEAIVKHRMRFIRHGSLYIPELKPTFLRLFSKVRPPDFCVNALIMQTQYALGKEFIRRSSQHETSLTHGLEILYTRMLEDGSKPISAHAKKFIQHFCERW